MNRSNTSPRSFSTDQLRAALGDVGGPARPEYLPGIVARAGHIRQRPAWTFLGGLLSVDPAGRRQGVPRAAVLLAVLSLLVALLVAGLVYVGSQRERPLRLPTTSGDWERVVIETPSLTGRVASIAVGPRGLLAVVGGDEPARLAVSTDGRTWTIVPDGQHPRLSNDSSFGMPTLVGTDRGFLMLQLNEVWSSEDGYDWRRLAGETTDPDLRMGGPDTAVVGGPGLVAVGDDKAWYSVDGSDWSVAAVPPLPAEILARPDSQRYFAMTGVTGAGNDLIAWGLADVPLAENIDEHLAMPLLWASHDGRTWVSVVDPEMDSVTTVTGGPHGFVAIGQAGSEPAVWLSADGEVWERVAEGDFTSPVKLELNSASATSAGYVVIGTDGQCVWYPCSAQDVVIWTSPDGRSWSRVPSANQFALAQAYRSVAWGSSFVVGGAYGGRPAIWISGSGPSATGSETSRPEITAIPVQPASLAGTWKATDPPPGGSHLTMEVIARPNGIYGVTIRADHASECDGAMSTMTGVGGALGTSAIVIPHPDYVCDDGTEAEAPSGPPLEEQLRYFSFSYDSLRDALYDPAGREWTRVEAAP